MLHSAALLKSPTTKRSVFFFLFFVCFVLAGLPFKHKMCRSVLDHSVLRLHFEGFSQSIKIAPSSFFTYEMKIYLVEVLKCESLSSSYDY